MTPDLVRCGRDWRARRYLPDYVEALADGAVDVQPVLFQRGQPVGPEAFADLEGIAVWGDPCGRRFGCALSRVLGGRDDRGGGR